MRVELVGGPADGREVDVDGAVEIHVPVMLPPKRMATEFDAIRLDRDLPEWVDPDLNPTFVIHRYRSDGAYIGEKSATSY